MDEELFELEYTDVFVEDINKFKKAGLRNLLKKIELLVNELKRHPEIGTGHPEKLKGGTDEMLRRIDSKHRLIYQVDEENKKVFLISAWGHYGDK